MWSLFPCIRRCRNRRESRPKATPLPLIKVTVVSSVLFVNQFGSMMIFPFLPFMVHDFFPELSREELGQKAGYLGSAFFVGNFIGSFAWGWAADIFGRKPIMLTGLVFTILTELLFGFSQNFVWAVTARFLWGLLNGNLGVVKTYISEICDDTNQAKGFSAIGTSAGIGRLVGSVVGGFMAQPASKYSVFQTSFFCKFPYLLPCLIGAAIGLCSLIAAAIFLDETLHKTKKTSSSHETEGQNSTDSGIELSAQLQDDDSHAGDSDCLIPGQSASLAVMESDVDSESDGGILSFDEGATSDQELLVNTQRQRKNKIWRIRHASWSPNQVIRRTQNRAGKCWTGCGACATQCINCTPKQVGLFLVARLKVLLLKLLEIIRLMKDRRVVLSTSLYGLYGGLHVMVNETFPLLMVTCYEHGGYHLDDNEIGIVIMCSGILQIMWQLTLYPYVVKYLGYRKTLQFGITIFVICYMLLPFSNRITGPISSSAGGPCSSNTTGNMSVFSGSGSGIFENETLNLNGSTDYCGTEDFDTIGVNENSVARVPIKVWLMLISIMFLLVISRVSGFVSLFVLVGNSTLPETRGSVNGISQSLVAVGRSVGPVLGSVLFAWSASSGLGWPLDYHFVFNLCALFSLVLIVISLFLPKSIEKKRLPEESPNS